MRYDITIAGKDYRLELGRTGGRWQCKLDGREIEMDAVLIRPDVVSLLINHKAYEIRRDVAGAHLWIDNQCYAPELRDPRLLRGRKGSLAGDQGPRKLLATMPGKVVRILADEKAEVEVGTGLLVVEAMKMQNEIKSPKKGIVRKIVALGASVNAGDMLAIVD